MTPKTPKPPVSDTDPFATTTGRKAGSSPVNENTFTYDLGNLSDKTIRGAGSFFGIKPVSSPFFGKNVGPFSDSLHASAVLEQFDRLTPQKLAEVQYKMWLGGFYPANYQPSPGLLRDEDRVAFRKFIIGLAANPAQGTLQETLDAHAQSGAGLPAAGHRDPTVVTLTNPDDLKAVIQAGAGQIYGKYLDPDLVNQFISNYQGQEAGYQLAKDASSGFDPMTGQQTGPGGGTTLTGPAQSPAGINLQFEDKMRQAHPVTAEMAEFVSHFGDLIGKLTK